MEHIVELQSKNYKASINLFRGANCISLRNSEYNAVILREPDYSQPLDNPFLYGMPIIYPANRISDGTFAFEGRTYTFPINEPSTNCHLHGVIHQAEFQQKHQQADSVECVYRAKATSEFPHDFEIAITYVLSEKGLKQETTIKNLSQQNMPNFLGFHTTFRMPFLEHSKPENVRVAVQVGEEVERNMAVYLPTGRILPEDEITQELKSGTFMPWQNILSRHYRIADTGLIELFDVEHHIKLVYKNDTQFGWRLIYNGNGDEFICIEPMTCMANCQNSPFDRKTAGFDFIEPDSSKTYHSEIYLEQQ